MQVGFIGLGLIRSAKRDAGDKTALISPRE